MKISITTLIPTALLLLTGCNSEFDLGEITSSEKPVIYCIPAPQQEMTIIQFSKSVPASQAKTPEKGVRGASVRLSVNGIEEEVYWNEDSTEILPPQCYYVKHRPQAGDRISISAEAEGLPVASSQTEVPETFPLKELKLARRPGTEPKLQFRISFQDQADSDDYYGVRIMRDNGVAISEVEAELDDEPLLNNKVGLDDGFDFDNSYYRNLYIWSDEQIRGKEYTLRLNTPYKLKTDGKTAAQENGTQDRFKICLYRLSADLYKFLKSLNDNTNNNLGEIGLAPLRSNYTNVTNGFGVVGGCNITESAWLTPSPEDK